MLDRPYTNVLLYNPPSGGSGAVIAGGKEQQPRQPKGRRGKVKRLKEGSNEN
jgi:hypothetical protein